MPRSKVEPPAIDMPYVLRSARNAVAFAVGYAMAARFTQATLSAPAFPPALFIPSAVVLIALLLTPPARWWTVLVSALAGHWVTSVGQGTSFVYMLESFALDSASAVLAATLIRRHVDLTRGHDTAGSMGAFTIIACISPMIVVLGSAALFQIDAPVGQGKTEGIGGSDSAAWLMAVLSNTLAFVTVVPAGLAAHGALKRAFANESRSVVRWSRVIEALGLATAAALVSAVVFAQLPANVLLRAAVLCAPIVLVMVAALRFGLAGAAATLIIAASVAMRGAVFGNPPFPSPATTIGIVAQQLVFLVLSTPLLLLAAAIDDRRRASSQLAQNDARYALATQAGGVFVYSHDPTSNAVSTDASLGEMLGLTPFDLQSPTWWWRQVHPDDTAALHQAWNARRQWPFGSADKPLDFRMLDSQGHVRWFRERAAPRLPDEPEGAPLAGTITDITALRTAELAAAQRARELAHVARTSTVGELAAALAHEIRQPLTAILINSQTAMRVLDSRPRDPQAVREILEQLASDGRRASEVIQRVRAFARKDDVERGPIDLNTLMREAVQIVRHDTIRRRAEIRFALTHEPLIVVGDRVQLQQVALNLVLNALEAIADQPPEAERLVLIETARAATHTATFTVRDTGPGVARERQAAIFEPFITSKKNGLGVGLSISRTIVEAHGGVIWCESDPAVGGAAFMVAIPLGNARRN